MDILHNNNYSAPPQKTKCISGFTKKLISFSLLFTLLISTLAFNPNIGDFTYAADEDKWDYAVSGVYQYADFSPFTTAETEYVIKTPEQLAGLAVLVNSNYNNDDELTGITVGVTPTKAITQSFYGATIKLANDIDLGAHEWVPIGLGTSNSNRKR